MFTQMVGTMLTLVTRSCLLAMEFYLRSILSQVLGILRYGICASRTGNASMRVRIALDRRRELGSLARVAQVTA